jgi:hypothetical protein
MTEKMKRKELYDIEKKLYQAKQPGKTFTFVIADNKKKVQEKIAEMEKQKEYSPAFLDYLKKIEELKKKHATKDHLGRPKMKPGNSPARSNMMFYDILNSEDPQSEFRKSLAELETANRELILEQDEKERKYWEEYLEEELGEFKFRMIKYTEVPKDITQEEMDAILFLVDYGENAKGDVR